MKKKYFPLILMLFFIIISFSVVRFNNNSIIIDLSDARNSPTSSNAINIEWSNDGEEICIEANTQWYQEIISDGTGGAIITWNDQRNVTTDEDIYAQKINSSGDVEWQANGTPICRAGDWQRNPEICSDGNGGAIIAWTDYRRSDVDIYVQRINSTGHLRWTVNGTPICIKDGSQASIDICSDGDGGAIIAWHDNRGADFDIYTQRINSSGDIIWIVNGTVICNETGDQFYPKICSDGAEGAIITWQDERNGSANADVYAQRINSSGEVRWMANGIPICTENILQVDIVICSDDAGGAIIAWQDYRSTVRRDLYAQRVDPNANPLWGINGTPVSISGGSVDHIKICSDEYGGAIIAWEDDRLGNKDIYAQRINSSGNIQWLINASPVCVVAGDQFYPDICSDGLGGTKITFERSMNIYIQWIHSSGNSLWTTNGVVICSAAGNQWGPKICCNTIGGSIVTWYDWRNPTYDIYAQYVTDIRSPNSSHPSDFNTTTLDSETIDWKLYGVVGQGKYRVWVNDTNDNYYIWRDWTDWINNTDLQIPINRSALGIFNYTIEYNNSWGQFGIPDTVIINIAYASPSENWEQLLILALGMQQPSFLQKLLDSLVNLFSEPIILGGIALVELIMLIAVITAYKRK